MIKKQILEYFQHQHKQFELNFESAFSTVDKNTIHDMRVSIKRLRLLYRFLDFASDKQFCAKKKAKLLIDVFKSAGPLRDAQIQISIIEKLKEYFNTGYQELNQFINLKEESGIQKFKEKGATFELEKINHLFNFSENLLKIIIAFPDLKSTFANYKKNRQHKIDSLLKAKNQEIDFHQVRKRIKDLTYLAEIQNLQSDESNNELANLKLLGRKLGDWHDIVVFLNEIANIKTEEQIPLADLIEIETKLKQQKQVIISEFYHEFSKK